jgi:hypothetical protein
MAGEKMSHGFWAQCLICGWLETYETRADAADGQAAHDDWHVKRPWRLSAQDYTFLKVNRIAPSEDSD